MIKCFCGLLLFQLKKEVGFEIPTTRTAMIFYCAVRYYDVLLDGLPVWGGALDRGIKGRGPRLTFDLKRALSNLKMEPESSSWKVHIQKP